jgi:hypothetical protein
MKGVGKEGVVWDEDINALRYSKRTSLKSGACPDITEDSVIEVKIRASWIFTFHPKLEFWPPTARR